MRGSRVVEGLVRIIIFKVLEFKEVFHPIILIIVRVVGIYREWILHIRI